MSDLPNPVPRLRPPVTDYPAWSDRWITKQKAWMQRLYEQGRIQEASQVALVILASKA